NACLEERIEAYRKRRILRTYFDQVRALSEWRQSDPEAASLPANLQRWTLKRVDDAYRGFFRRAKTGGKPGFPRFRGKGRFKSFGFAEFSGITFFENDRIRFKGMPGSLRVHLHRALPPTSIKSCVFSRKEKGWIVGFAVEATEAMPLKHGAAVGV